MAALWARIPSGLVQIVPAPRDSHSDSDTDAGPQDSHEGAAGLLLLLLLAAGSVLRLSGNVPPLPRAAALGWSLQPATHTEVFCAGAWSPPPAAGPPRNSALVCHDGTAVGLLTLQLLGIFRQEVWQMKLTSGKAGSTLATDMVEGKVDKGIYVKEGKEVTLLYSRSRTSCINNPTQCGPEGHTGLWAASGSQSCLGTTQPRGYGSPSGQRAQQCLPQSHGEDCGSARTPSVVKGTLCQGHRGARVVGRAVCHTSCSVARCGFPSTVLSIEVAVARRTPGPLVGELWGSRRGVPWTGCGGSRGPEPCHPDRPGTTKIAVVSTVQESPPRLRTPGPGQLPHADYTAGGASAGTSGPARPPRTATLLLGRRHWPDALLRSLCRSLCARDVLCSQHPKAAGPQPGGRNAHTLLGWDLARPRHRTLRYLQDGAAVEPGDCGPGSDPALVRLRRPRWLGEMTLRVALSVPTTQVGNRPSEDVGGAPSQDGFAQVHVGVSWAEWRRGQYVVVVPAWASAGLAGALGQPQALHDTTSRS
ncbi:putative G-protein coupled receptor 133 [Tupaia chinensis]|uniref:Putative G-protein coupled receptor 133 n=1 Tax=Tupaia chinensis TaxID=246437 RepID=L9KWD2_TUPCH|nr:putative G-protein coupled receptor 133 [Tupaia chinensis]